MVVTFGVPIVENQLGVISAIPPDDLDGGDDSDDNNPRTRA
jgi:hypothetical protein